MTRSTASTSTVVPVFDASVEQNNEKLRFISEICGNSPDKREEHTNLPAPESGTITPHAGIMGVGDLDKNVMGWSSDGAALLRVARSKR